MKTNNIFCILKSKKKGVGFEVGSGSDVGYKHVGTVQIPSTDLKSPRLEAENLNPLIRIPTCMALKLGSQIRIWHNFDKKFV